MNINKAVAWTVLRSERYTYITHIGPLLEYGLNGGTSKALKGLPLFLLSCLSVCMDAD